eukprot:2291593-Prorocentrum_lima.AAC.1
MRRLAASSERVIALTGRLCSGEDFACVLVRRRRRMPATHTMRMALSGTLLWSPACIIAELA